MFKKYVCRVCHIKHLGQTYLLTYKLSQDYVETFFGAVRARGGFNNNLNALQFKLVTNVYLLDTK
jgi:hypothetical protein